MKITSASGAPAPSSARHNANVRTLMLLTARFVAAFLGLYFLARPPLLAFQTALNLEPDRPIPWLYLLIFVGIGLVLSAGYFLVALWARFLASSVALRVTAACLLSFPTAMATRIAIVTRDREIRITCLLGLGLTLLLASALVWPMWLRRSNSGMQPTPASGAADAER